MVLQFTLFYKTDCAHKLIYGILSKISDIGVHYYSIKQSCVLLFKVSCTKRYYFRIWFNFFQNSSLLYTCKFSYLKAASIKIFGRTKFIFVAYTGFAIPVIQKFVS